MAEERNIETPEADGQTADKKPRRHKPFWRRALKWTGISLLSLIVLIVAVFCVALWYLTPERLTPLVNKYASEYLNADVNAGRVELTFWSTFPRLNVDVQNLTVISRSLDKLPAGERDSLPADADSLLGLERFTGGVHVLGALKGRLDLYDVELTNPKVNLLVVNDSINNFDIVPPSEEAEESEGMEISINRFALIGEMPVRYRSLADSVDVALTLTRTELGGLGAPAYTLALSGKYAPEMFAVGVPELPFSIDGMVNWDMKRPELLGLKDFEFGYAGVTATMNADIDMGDELIVNQFDVSVPHVEVGRMLQYLPEDMAGNLRDIDSDLTVGLTARLLKPYNVASEAIPDMEVNVKADASKLVYDAMNINKIALDVTATVDGADLDKTVVNINKCEVVGRAMDFSIKGKITNPMSNPYVNGRFEGNLSFDRLPRKLLDHMPMTIAGRLSGEFDIRLRQNDLTPKRLHRVKLDGKMALTNFRAEMRDSTMAAYIHDAQFRLGSSSKIQLGEHLVDSLLTASLTIDTAAIAAPGLSLAGRDMSVNVGLRNVASSSDTTQINPIGGRLHAGMLTLRADSMATRMRLRNATVGGALRRYNSDARSPQLDLVVEADRISYRDAEAGAGISNARATLTLHPRARRPMSARMQARIDSLAAVYPELSTDSLTQMARRLARRRHTASPAADDGRENIDFEIDNSLASWLRLWQLSGELTANRAMLFTPYFPTRNRLSDINVSFSTDSVVVRNTKLRSGRSDFLVNGAVRNISRALTSRRHRQPIEVEFDMQSDTININDITATMLRGAAYSEHLDSTLIAGIDDFDEEVFEAVDSASESAIGALVVPSNVKADLNVKARHVLYGDLWLNDFAGRVNVFDGAVSLDQLRARTEMGAVEMTALYSAPTRDDMHFAAGMKLTRLDLHKILHQIPQIDSIMPMLSYIEGIVDARMAITSDLDTMMNLKMESLDMALKLSGDSLVLLDSETFRTVSKWLLFKNKKRNMIDHMDVEITVHDGWLDLYPVIFDMDRYRLGVVGNNDLNFNLDYHVAVLKSPIPFKFGINIKGTPEKMKIRLGGAKINEKSVAKSSHLTDSVRVNLMQEMRKAFRRGIRTTGRRGLQMQRSQRQSAGTKPDDPQDALAPADSMIFIKEGLIEAPEGFVMPDDEGATKTKERKR